MIIPFIDWEIEPWLKGIVIAFLTALPIMIIVYSRDKKAIIPMIISSFVLGGLIGIAWAKFIG